MKLNIIKYTFQFRIQLIGIIIILCAANIFGQDQKVADTKSLFETIYESEGRPKITVNTDMKTILRKSEIEEYQEAKIDIDDADGNSIISVLGRARTRGNVRKEVCRFPPIKLDFKKSTLKDLGFLKMDRLKLVFPCGSREFEQKKLFKEYFAYQLFDVIDTIGLRTKLVDISIGNEDFEVFEFVGFLVEDEKEYARRNNAEILEDQVLKWPALEREPLVKVQFFQYMIANTDWAIITKHNLEMVKFPNRQRVVPVPYDFDYAGIVGQHYAVPAENLPIKSVRDRYFVPYPVEEDEFYRMVDFFLSKEDEIMNLCDSATYMDEKSIDENKKFISKFFDILRKPKSFLQVVLKGI